MLKPSETKACSSVRHCEQWAALKAIAGTDVVRTRNPVKEPFPASAPNRLPQDKRPCQVRTDGLGLWGGRLWPFPLGSPCSMFLVLLHCCKSSPVLLSLAFFVDLFKLKWELHRFCLLFLFLFMHCSHTCESLMRSVWGRCAQTTFLVGPVCLWHPRCSVFKTPGALFADSQRFSQAFPVALQVLKAEPTGSLKTGFLFPASLSPALLLLPLVISLVSVPCAMLFTLFMSQLASFSPVTPFSNSFCPAL